jgi:hypothetical protein
MTDNLSSSLEHYTPSNDVTVCMVRGLMESSSDIMIVPSTSAAAIYKSAHEKQFALFSNFATITT